MNSPPVADPAGTLTGALGSLGTGSAIAGSGGAAGVMNFRAFSARPLRMSHFEMRPPTDTTQNKKYTGIEMKLQVTYRRGTLDHSIPLPARTVGPMFHFFIPRGRPKKMTVGKTVTFWEEEGDSNIFIASRNPTLTPGPHITLPSPKNVRGH